MYCKFMVVRCNTKVQALYLSKLIPASIKKCKMCSIN